MDTRLEKLRIAVESSVEGMSSEQMRWHPPGKWCAAEVLEHLFLSYTGTIKGFEKLLQSGQPTTKSASAKQRWQTFVVLVLGHLPEGRKALRSTEPAGLSSEHVQSEIGRKIEAMDAIIDQSETRFGRGVPLLDHPILGPLSGRQWRKFHLLHGMHHRKQMLHLRNSADTNK
jgi:hypothetical protein